MSDYEKAAKSMGITVEELDRRVRRFVDAEKVGYHRKRSCAQQQLKKKH